MNVDEQLRAISQRNRDVENRSAVDDLGELRHERIVIEGQIDRIDAAIIDGKSRRSSLERAIKDIERELLNLEGQRSETASRLEYRIDSIARLERERINRRSA